jgi:two-component system, cell cycle sensor histidine kinase and response regulator CckA
MVVKDRLRPAVKSGDAMLLWLPLAAVCSYVLVDFSDLRLGGVPSLLANAATAILTVLSVVAAWRARMRVRRNEHLRMSWQMLALGFLLNAIGEINWIVLENVLGMDPVPVWANYPFFAAYIPLLLGLMRFPPRVTQRREQVRFTLDILTVAIGASMLIWYFIVIPAMEQDGSWADHMVALAYPVGDFALLVGVAALLLREPPQGYRIVLNVLAAGIAMQLLGDLILSYQSVHEGYETGGATDIFWVVAYWLQCFTATLQRSAPVYGRRREKHRALRPFSVLPYAAIVLSYGLLIFVAAREAGYVLWTLVLASVVLTAVVAMRQLIALRENVRLMAEREIARNELRFRSLVQNASDVIMIADAAGCVTYCSPSAERVIGYPLNDIMGEELAKYVHPEDIDDIMQSCLGMALQESRQMSGRLRHRDGHWLNTESTVTNLANEPSIAGVVINIRDVTERSQLAEQFQQSQKMEAVGRLAGGVAHDFNNLLTAIQGNARLLLATGVVEDAREELEEIAKASDRAAQLTRQLLAFSRKQMVQPVTVDPNEVIVDIERMLRRLLPETIALKASLTSTRMVRADTSQLEQVLMNLVVNARDAVGDRGRIDIVTADETLTDDVARKYGANARAGEYVVIRVTDDGCGMPASVLAHIFEPFFTTKSKFNGTGLGLSTVYGIIEQSQGWIHVKSVVSMGTTFTVGLPARRDEAAIAQDAVAVAPEPHAWETILIVEDESAVRSFARKTLQRRGYRVLEADCGETAIELADAFDAEIHLLLTDVLMPGVSGARVAELLKQRRPGTEVLYMSGYSDEVLSRAGVSPEQFLQKPFDPDTLLKRVREMMPVAV